MPSNSHINRGDDIGGSNVGKQLKALHLGKSIDDLNSQAKVETNNVIQNMVHFYIFTKISQVSSQVYLT